MPALEAIVTMAIETTKVRSRRALLAGAAAGVAGVAVGRLAQPLPAQAADLDPVILGTYQSSTKTTSIQGGGLRVEGGELPAALIVHGVNNGAGILANSMVEDVVTPDSTHGSGTGIDGQSGTGIGVRGYAADGTGVHGISDAGIGVLAESAGVCALSVIGKVAFSSADRGTIIAGRSRATVMPPGGLSGFALVLVTLQGNPSGKRASAFSHVELNPSAGTFDVVLTGPAARAVDFGYFVIG